MQKLDLRGCHIVAPAERAGFVDQAIEDLTACTGGTSINGVGEVEAGTVVLVGKQAVRDAARTHEVLSHIGLDGLSDQGFLLETVRANGIDFAVCVGGGSRGDAYAVIELIKAIDGNGGEVLLEETARREEPFFIRRGMYAHQHWAYEYPYALRSWGFDDWRRYIDFLAYLRINFFSIWSMAAILPSPLSQGDREYLENYRRVIDYAKNRRGMEVFIGECANNVAEDDGGVPIQQRDYFGVEVLKDPSDPAQFADIMANRRSLYSTADNADGYWIIDSDPGGFEGSPPEDFVKIILGNRELIDQCAVKGRDAKLAYWMWMGWGKGKPRDERQRIVRQTVEMMRDSLREPWVLLPCWSSHMDYAREMGYIDKSIFFPYGTIEDEPSPPTTRLRFGEIHAQLNSCISEWGCRNAMGNAQSPWVQLPNIFCFAEMAWNGVPPFEPAAKDVVAPLARLMAPDIAHDLAEGWLTLVERDAGKAIGRAERLERIASEGKVGEAGVLGRCYFPDVGKLLTDLALQLRVHGTARLLCEALARPAPADEVTAALVDYYDAAIKWHSTHNFRRCHCYGPDVWEIAELWRSYREKAALTANYMSELKAQLLGKGYDEWTVDGYVALTAPG